GERLRKIHVQRDIDDRLVVCDDTRPTTTKQRFLGRSQHRQPQQILRVDCEAIRPLGTDLQRQFTDELTTELAGFDAVLISDYAKGVCTAPLLRTLIDKALSLEIPVLVDPARIGDYRPYAKATIITPNRVEAELASGIAISTPQTALRAARRLRRTLELQAALVTLDRDGLALAETHHRAVHLPTVRRDVCDVTGAGDTVLAVLGLAISSGAGLVDAAKLANLAAGLQVEHVGVATITPRMLQSELAESRTATSRKVVSLDQMSHLAANYRRDGRTLVLTNGCFDLLHAGHVCLLEEAAAHGDVFIVAINDDASLRRLKGPARPLIGQADRARLLAALDCVDHVVVFGADTPHEVLRRLRPEFLVKGGTYSEDQVVGRELVREYGGRVLITGCEEGRSTSSLLDRILQTSRNSLGKSVDESEKNSAGSPSLAARS
ncbi:MAG: PfkB family carbohydrate kinase, partial [Pirellulaceae bacterium]